MTYVEITSIINKTMMVIFIQDPDDTMALDKNTIMIDKIMIGVVTH